MEKRLFLVPIFVFCSLAVLVYFTVPAYKDFIANTKQIGIYQQELQEKQNFYDQLRATENSLADFSEAFIRIDTAIPSDIFEPELLSYFQETTSDFGLLLGGISITPGGYFNDSNIKESSISLSIEGSMPAFESFLAEVEKSSRFFEVKQISFSYDPDNPQVISFSLGIKTFSY